MPKNLENILPGSQLAAFLKHIKLRQNALAKEMDLPTSTIARYSTGRTDTPAEVVDYLYKKYNLNLDWWHTGKGAKTRNTEPAKKSVILDIGQIIDRIQVLELKLREQDKKILQLTRELHQINGAKRTH